MKGGSAIRSLALGIALAVGTLGVGVSLEANAQMAVFDPANYVQNFMTQLRAVQSNLNEVRQLQQQIQQYQNMLKNTEGLKGGSWNQANDAINRLGNVLEEGESLSIAAGSFGSAFKARFPGYVPQKDYAAAYKRWNETSRDSILGAMRAANLQVQDMKSEDGAINALRMAASSTTGQKAAMDAGNQIAMAQINQLQNLRELMVAQMQAEGAYMASQEQQSAAKAASVQEATKFKSSRDSYKPNAPKFQRPTE